MPFALSLDLTTSTPLSPLTVTDRLFTGQRWDDTIGLYDYNARFYDPYLNRFISPDTIVPDPANPQSFNRYSYVLNNPVRYTDPSGHCIPGVDCPGDYGEGNGLVDHRWRHEGMGLGAKIRATAAFEHFLEDPNYFRQAYLFDPSNDELGYLSLYAEYHEGVYLDNLLGIDAGPFAALAYADLCAAYEAGLIDREMFATSAIMILGIVFMADFGDGVAERGGASIWTPGKPGDPVRNAFEHWRNHSSEFSEYDNALQYVEGTWDFIDNPPPGTLTKTRANGDILYYDPASNTFAVRSSSGAPRTMFRPDNGIDYWNKQ